MVKKILLITPKFYSYEKEIAEALKDRGYDVRIKYDLSSSFIYKLAIKFNIVNIKKYNEYFLFKNIIKQIYKEDYESVFIIKGFGLNLKLINEMSKHVNVKCYQWDSICNFNYKNLIPYYSDVYTFDPIDASNNAKLKYSPLFFSPLSKYNEEEKNIDILHLGSFSMERYNLLKDILYIIPQDVKFNFQLYIKPYQYIYHRFICGIKIDLRLITFKAVSRKDFYYNLKRTKIIIDIPSSKQSGLTMRFFESIAANVIVITTSEFKTKVNPCIYKYCELFTMDEIYKTSCFEEIRNRKLNFNYDDYQEYSLSNWLSKMDL